MVPFQKYAVTESFFLAHCGRCDPFVVEVHACICVSVQVIFFRMNELPCPLSLRKRNYSRDEQMAAMLCLELTSYLRFASVHFFRFNPVPIHEYGYLLSGNEL